MDGPQWQDAPLGMVRQSLIIREASDGDASSVASLLGELGYPAAARDLPRRLARVAERGSAVALAAEIEGRVVGVATAHAFASIHAERDIAWLTTLAARSLQRPRDGPGLVVVSACQ